MSILEGIRINPNHNAYSRKLALSVAAITVLVSGCGSAESAADDNIASTTEDSSEIVIDADVEPEDGENESNTSESELQSTLPVDDENNLVEDAVQAYATFLQTDEHYTDSSLLKAALIHVDNDDVPELAISYGSSHPNGIGFFSYDGNSITKLGWYGSYGCACYEPKNGILYGYYSGMGSTFDEIGIVENCMLEKELTVSIFDVQSDPRSDQEGFIFSIVGDEGEEDTEISQEEYEQLLTPYLIENRDYKIIYHENLTPLQDMDNVEEGLLKSLEMENDYPKPDANYQDEGLFSIRVTPDTE